MVGSGLKIARQAQSFFQAPADAVANDSAAQLFRNGEADSGLAAIPHVVQAERLFGDPDYLLRIVTTDLAAYQRLQDDQLTSLPGVQRMTSTLVMKRIVHDRPLPA